MKQEKQPAASGNVFALFLLICNAVIIKSAFLNNQNMYWWLLLSVPLLVLSMLDTTKKKAAKTDALRQTQSSYPAKRDTLVSETI